MQGAMILGLCFGVGFWALQRFAPQPIGWVGWWTFIAVQLGWAAWLTWRRTALPWMTMAMLLGSMTSAVLSILSAVGLLFPELPIRLAAPVYLLIAAGQLCLLIESRVHRAEWRQLKQHMQGKSALDILLVRHIPNLRGRT